MPKDEMTWDLSHVVESTSLALIQKKLKSMVVEAKKYEIRIMARLGDWMRKVSLNFWK
jgi:hypothetical protein